MTTITTVTYPPPAEASPAGLQPPLRPSGPWPAVWPAVRPAFWPAVWPAGAWGRAGGHASQSTGIPLDTTI